MSGFGRTHGKHALLDFVNTKHIGVEGQGKRDWNFPYSADRQAVIDGGLEVNHGSSLVGRARAAMGMLLPFWKVRRGDRPGADK